MAQATLTHFTEKLMPAAMPAWLKQLLMLGGVAGSVALGLAMVLWSQQPAYSVLYSSLPAERATAVMDTLTSLNIPYQLEKNTGALMVPEAELHNARLKLAGSGVVQTQDGTGLEMIRAEKGFGVSEFMETRKYQHALEVELARTIESIQQVHKARVHLALPKQSVFVRDRKPASASVMVDIRPGSTLEQKNVTAIMNLVAASIPELSTEQVTVVDQQGNLLSRVERDDALELSNRQFGYRQQVEKAYEDRIERLLSAMVPSGLVRVQVSADMDFSSLQESRESYNPAGTVVRSEQITTTGSDKAMPPATGVPGALSNQPPAASTPAPANAQTAVAAPATGSQAVTRNYEVERVLNYTNTPAGAVRKLSVAVVVDSTPLRDSKGKILRAGPSPAEIERMTNVVQGAIGYVLERGDRVTVVGTNFSVPEVASDTASTTAFWQESWFADLVKQALVGLAVLLLALGVLRPLLKQALAPALPAPATSASHPALAMAASADGHAPSSMQFSHSGVNGLPAPAQHPVQPLALSNTELDQRMHAVRLAASEDPRLVAQVVKTWVTPHDA
ncbi:MAG: flagellar basal-body MS-ring/collar protein FliF [Pseudomonadota bacterium]